VECIVPDCPQPPEAAAPVGLCAHHAAVVAEWHDRAHGVTDVAPTPCRACGSRLGVRWPSGWLCAVCEWRLADVPDDDLSAPRVDVVYYLAYRDRVKIGTTANPRQRFAAIRHDDLLALERGDRGVERRRHEQFADLRWAGSEWFRRSPQLDAHIAALAAGVSDPWVQWARWRSEASALRG
jgi:hypothetical protein